MNHRFALACSLGFTLLAPAAVFAQNVISAKSGLVHYIEGDVSVDGKAVSEKAGTFADVKKGSQLSTGLGRAEMLLTPGVFLRVSEKSEARMLDNRLADTRVELLSGKVMLESDTPMKDNLVTLLYKGYAVTPTKYGLFELTANPAQMKVYSGEVQVAMGGEIVRVKEGKLVNLSAALAQERFDNKLGDDLFTWSRDRSEYISVANVSSARTADRMGFGGTGYLDQGYGNQGYGSWFYNNNYGMYTYLPYDGTFFNAFGYGFWSPVTIGSAYLPGTTYTTGSSSAATGSLTHPIHTVMPPVTRASMGSSSGFGGFSPGPASGRPGLAIPVSLSSSHGAASSARGR